MLTPVKTKEGLTYNNIIDKIIHGILFFILFCLQFSGLYTTWKYPKKTFLIIILTFLWGAITAIFTDLAQDFITSRETNIYDIISNLLGEILGTSFVLIFNKKTIFELQFSKNAFCNFFKFKFLIF